MRSFFGRVTLLVPLGALSAVAACSPASVPVAKTVLEPADAALAERLRAADEVLARVGGVLELRLDPVFLRTKQSLAQTVTLPAGSCWYFLGLAGDHVRDLDLILFDLLGQRLDADDRPDPHPVIVHCVEGPAGKVVVVSPLVDQGAGEVVVVLYRFAPGAAPRRGEIDFGELLPLPDPTAETLEEAIERMDRLMLREGLRPVGERERLELVHGRDAVYRRRIAAGTCLGVGLVGDRDAANLDLWIQLGARKVAEDRRQARDAHVTYCSNATIEAQIYATSGEGRASAVLMFYEAPLRERIFVTPTELPEEPQADRWRHQSFEQQVQELDGALRARGFIPDGPPTEGTLLLGAQAVWRLWLLQGNCYEIAALPRPGGITDLDLMLENDAGLQVAEDDLPTNNPRLSFCPEETGTYRLVVHAYRGGGDYVAWLYRFGATIPPLPGVSGRLSAAYARLASQVLAKGFRPVGTPTRQLAEPGHQHSHTIRMERGTCYVVGVVVSSGDMDVDLEVCDDLLRRVSADVERDPDARVYVCPARTAHFHARVKVSRGRGQYMLVLFEHRGD